MKRKSFKSLVLALIAAMLIFIPVLGTSQNVDAATSTTSKQYETKYNDARKVLDLVNEKRKQKNLPALTLDANLEQSAMLRAKELVTKYSHTRPNGQNGLSLIPGNVYKGENIAKGQTTSAQVFTAWYNSTGHRDNMLNKNYKSIGIGCVRYNNTNYWVQLFSSATAKPPRPIIQWVKENGKHYCLKDGKKIIGWYYFTSNEGEKTPHWSYFDKNGYLLTGWQQLGVGTNNPDKNNKKHWSYFGDNGWLRTGWQEMGVGTNNPDKNNKKHWSYFGDDGWLRTGWQEMGVGTKNPDKNNKKHWSYFGGNGWLVTGKQTINKKVYTFNGQGWLTNPSKP